MRSPQHTDLRCPEAAYTERQTSPHWQQLTRRLLRFTTAISNSGTADFRPAIPKQAWQWHACHQVAQCYSDLKLMNDTVILCCSIFIPWRHFPILRFLITPGAGWWKVTR